MTQEDFDNKVALVLAARKIIKALREEELLKESYVVIFNASLNGITKKLAKTKLDAE